jgi:hypothetical protein
MEKQNPDKKPIIGEEEYVLRQERILVHLQRLADLDKKTQKFRREPLLGS